MATEPEDLPGDMGSMLKVMQIAEKIGALDIREDGHFKDLSGKLSNAFKIIHGVRQALAAHDGLPDQVAEVVTRLAALETVQGGDDGGEEIPPWVPGPTFDWWERYDHPDIDDAKRDQLLAARKDRLQAIVDFVTDIYRPGWGHMAAEIPDCWAQHPLCVQIFDVMAEMWGYLCLQPKRGWGILLSQAEFQTRFMPAWATQLKRETEKCKDGHLAVPGTQKGTGPR